MNNPIKCSRLFAVTIGVVALFPPAARAADASHMDGYVAVPLRRSGNFIVIETRMNGHSVPLLVDTGSPVTTLSQSAYGFSVTRGAEKNLPANVQHKFSVNGKPASAGWVQEMRAGDMNFGSGPVAVTDLSTLRRSRYEAGHEHRNVEGLLGLDVLMRYSAILDPGRQVIYFNTDPAKRAKLGPLLIQNGWTPIPMTLTPGRHLSVPTEIDGHAFQLEVDTGAFTTGVDSGRLAALKFKGKDIPVSAQILNMKRVKVQALVLKDWKLGSYVVPSFPVGMEQLPPILLNDYAVGRPILGLLGAEVLLINHAIIDLGGMKLYLHPY